MTPTTDCKLIDRTCKAAQAGLWQRHQEYPALSSLVGPNETPEQQIGNGWTKKNIKNTYPKSTKELYICFCSDLGQFFTPNNTPPDTLSFQRLQLASRSSKDLELQRAAGPEADAPALCGGYGAISAGEPPSDPPKKGNRKNVWEWPCLVCLPEVKNTSIQSEDQLNQQVLHLHGSRSTPESPKSEVL